MKPLLWWIPVYSLPLVYELSGLFFGLPDYFSWLLWILLWPLILISAFVCVAKSKYSTKITVAILVFALAYLPYIFGILKLKSNLFFTANKSAMEHFVKHKDADSLDKLKKEGITSFDVNDGYVYFPMDTDSDWCWGYAFSLKKEKPKSNSWCPIEKWTMIDNGWFRWAK